MRLTLAPGPEESLALPAQSIDAMTMKAGDAVGVLAVSGGVAVISSAESPRPYLAGSLATLNAGEAVQNILSSLKTGVLHFSYPADRHRTIYFRDGQVVFAASSDLADRVGSVLWRQGMVSDKDLARCIPKMRTGRPIGQIMVDEGILTAAELYAGVALHVREIVLACFTESVGSFIFVEGPFEERNAVKLPERTRELLLEGIRRMEEVERIGFTSIQNREAPLKRAGNEAGDVGAHERKVLELVDGKRTAQGVVTQGNLGLYDGLRAIANLIKLGVLAPVGPAPARQQAPPEEEEVFSVSATSAPAGKASGPFETYRRVIRHVYGALLEAQPKAQMRLNGYFDRLPEKQKPIFEGVRLDAEGDIDVAQVLINVTGTGAYKGAAAKARSLEALEAFVSFALFEAKNALDKEAVEKLLREVGKMQVGKL
jgi:hypothetical protein